MLEFYSVPSLAIPLPMLPAGRRPRAGFDASRVCARALSVAFVLAALGAVAGCATPPPTKAEPAAAPQPSPRAPAAKGTASDAEPPPPAVNLSGFPLAYRQGYADGCASAAGTERQDRARYAADGNYRTGWQDGRAICGKK